VYGSRSWLAFLGVAGAYYGSAKLGLELSVAHGVITPVWPPTGISLAALLVFGPRLWPAVALGAFAGNATSGVSLAVAAGISVGNTLEALVGVYLLRRVGFRRSLDRVRDVLALATLGALVSTTASATNGVLVLTLANSPNASPFGSAWRLWWLGDAMGDLLVAPLLLVWAAHLPRVFPRARRIEAAALLGLLVGASAAVFLGGAWRYPYVLFPLLIWATLRFEQRGAATASFVVAAIAVAGVVHGDTPLAGHSTTFGVQALQALLAVVAVSLMVLGAILSERDAAKRALQHANENLAEAQQLAHIGSWAWDFGTNRMTWSAELYRIFGLPESTELTYETFLARVHPGDRDRVRAAVEPALAERSPVEFTHRIVLDDGSEKTLQGRGSVVVDAAGAPVRMLGTAQDVTERQRLEEVRENILSSVSHELRTPLTSIVGFALTLRERTLAPDDRAKLVHHLAEQALRLEGLLADLLDVDRLRHAQLRTRAEPTNVGQLVARIAGAHSTNGNSLDVAVEPVVAGVDAAKLERIVENLIANALKHTPPGTNVSVRVERDPGGVLICVDDSGPGIPDEHKATIFDLFARGTNAVPSVAGTGVGLALVAQFTALHGGRAWVEDNPGGGASFRVLLPASS